MRGGIAPVGFPAAIIGFLKNKRGAAAVPAAESCRFAAKRIKNKVAGAKVTGIASKKAGFPTGILKVLLSSK